MSSPGSSRDGRNVIWCRFEVGGHRAYGIVEGDEVHEIKGSPFDSYSMTSETRPLSAVKLLVPSEPRALYASGNINYRMHYAWARDHGLSVLPTMAERPQIGACRSLSALIATNDPIVIPHGSSGDVHYEAELMGVIGRKAKHLTLEEAREVILGYTICNDVSERTWQRTDRTMWRAKDSDTFWPVGPWIVAGFDPSTARTTVRINGRVTTEFATGAMLFDLPQYLVELTRYVTVHPGDLFTIGCDGETFAMHPGDVVEIEITGLGTLRNPVVAEALERQPLAAQA